jgi:CxxC-x17-CxxC domain-containing protein
MEETVEDEEETDEEETEEGEETEPEITVEEDKEEAEEDAGEPKVSEKKEVDSFNREMHKAVCADCGKSCEVPFKPTEGRPVYCRDCYRKHVPQRRRY